MNLSYWEYKTWLSNIDFAIVGSGIVGLNCSLSLRKKYPKAKILVLEKGILPQGASTKNAGFACFGSISEILADLKQHSEDEVVQLVQKRWNGVQLLRKNLGDSHIDFQQHGGHELFWEKDKDLFDTCFNAMSHINRLLQPIFRANAFVSQENTFGFSGIQDTCISNRYEGQIDTGKMMSSLLDLVQSKGIRVLNCITVEGFVENRDGVAIKTDRFEFSAKKVFVATNGFASQLLNEKVSPARAQVLITKPIENLPFKGTFHLDEGYYYFRNINDRILFGGGRNLNFKAEETTVFGETKLIQNRLEKILRENILPNTAFEVDLRWSGIMGMGKQKNPIVKQISDHVRCGVRLGGMGIAIGSLIGKELADLP